MTLTLPPALRPGDTVSLVAPAGPIDPVALELAVRVLERRGLKTKTYRDVTSRLDYLAGADDHRAAEMNAALVDPDTRAVLPIRGGYGVVRILDQLDYAALSSRPKLICGFSDITALHAAVHRHAGVATFHSPNLQDGIGNADTIDPTVAATYWQALMGEELDASVCRSVVAQAETLCEGRAEGPLVGGNLAVLGGLIGTPYEPDTTGAILLLEDIGEAVYRIDRLLAQLKLAGKLQGLAGVVLGQFTAEADQEPIDHEQLRRVFIKYFGPLGVPVIANYPVGHTKVNLVVPLGVPVGIDGDTAALDLSPAYTLLAAHRASSTSST